MKKTWPLLMQYLSRRRFLRCFELAKNLQRQSSSVFETASVGPDNISALKNDVKTDSATSHGQLLSFKEEKSTKQGLASCNAEVASGKVERALGFATASTSGYDVSGTSSLVTNIKNFMEAFNLAVSWHQNNTVASLHDIMNLIENLRKTSDFVPPRIIYLAMDLALHLNQLDIAKSLSEVMPKKVHILATSLRIRLFAAQKRFADGLKEIENVLNEDAAGLTVECKVTNLALDELHHAIASAENTKDEMRRFRYLQRVVTKYKRRTDMSFTALLYSPVYMLNEIPEEPVRNTIEVDKEMTEKILKLAPHVLTIDD